MGVLSINLGPLGLKIDGIPSIDGELTSLETLFNCARHGVPGFDFNYVPTYPFVQSRIELYPGFLRGLIGMAHLLWHIIWTHRGVLLIFLVSRSLMGSLN